MPSHELQLVVVAVPRLPGDRARLDTLMQKIDTAPLAPRAALADLDETEAQLVTEITLRCLRAVLESTRETPPDPHNHPST